MSTSDRRPKIAALLFTLALAGCYGPKVADGELPCSTDGQQCPSGLVCAANRFCYHSGSLSTSLFGTGLTGDLDLTNKGPSILVDTETGTISVENGPVLMDHPAGFQNLPQPSGGPSVGMWNFGNLTVPAGTIIRPTLASKSAVVLLATGKIQLDGDVTVNGFGGFFGTPDAAGSPGPGGPAMSGGAPGGVASGGGGGGFGSNGIQGMGSGGGVGGGSFGSDPLVPLYFGSGGGGGGGVVEGDGTGGTGGAGGGALAIVGQQVVVNGTLSANGANGGPARMGGAGSGGGGAGGSVLVIAQTLKFGAASVLFATGGAGDTSGTGPGGDGGEGRITLYGEGQPNAAAPAVKTASPLPTTFPR